MCLDNFSSATQKLRQPEKTRVQQNHDFANTRGAKKSGCGGDTHAPNIMMMQIILLAQFSLFCLNYQWQGSIVHLPFAAQYLLSFR